jgi:tetratricopeptide (TPR) repeat protein
MVGLTHKNIVSFINNPENIEDSQLNILINLADKYPFSGFLNTLLAKIYNVRNHISYKTQLQKAAITSSDREILYYYIQRDKLLNRIKDVIKDDEDVIEKSNSTKKLKDDSYKDKELEVLEKNVLSAAINLSIQQEVVNDVIEIEEENKNKDDLSTVQMPLTFWLFSEVSNNEVERVKKPFFSPLETAKLSIVDNEEFVSETLAEIHVKQGNYPKAIKIYDKLILNYPEKKVFFASRIRYIKEKINYT